MNDPERQRDDLDTALLADHERWYAAIGYMFILCFISLWKGKESDFVRFHGRQAFALFIGKEKDFRGISEDTARELWMHFKSDIYQHLQAENQAAFAGILTVKKIKALFKGFKKYKNLKHAKWFTEIGIPVHIQQRLLKYHNEKSVDLMAVLLSLANSTFFRTA